MPTVTRAMRPQARISAEKIDSIEFGKPARLKALKGKTETENIQSVRNAVDAFVRKSKSKKRFRVEQHGATAIVFRYM